MTGITALTWLPTGLALAGVAYQVFALVAVRRFFAWAPGDTAPAEPVTILKPLYGAEPRLAANLASFVEQDYAGAVQMVCGVGTARDGAVGAVEALRRSHPAADITLVTGPGARASNGKIGNLVAMMPAARHDMLVLSDSDIAAAPDYLKRVTAALSQPGVGAVSCLYVGRGDAGIWSRIGATAISSAMMPNMVVGLGTGMAQPCMGSTIALRRDVLEAFGGFGRFADVLADDHAIGAAVAALGLTVAIPPMLVTHAGDEASLGALWRHHLRWAVTIRGLAPAGHYGSVITHALPLALVATAFHPAAGLTLTGLALTSRLAVAGTVRSIAGSQAASIRLLVLADCLGFVVFVASLVTRTIDWRGLRLTMAADGRIAAPEMEDR